jgi:membrane associated rhomboid family serine protease
MARMSRHPAPAWLRPITQRLSPTIRNLVILQAVVFGLYIMAAPLRAPITRYLGLGPWVWTGEVWQLLTALFVNTDLWAFFFSVLGLWFAGVTIEQALGRRRFLLLFFGTGLAANAVIVGLMPVFGVDASAAGCGQSVLAIFVALGVIYGRAPLRVWGQLALQARILAWIFVGMSLLASLLQGSWGYLAATVVAQSLAYFISGGKAGPVTAFFAGLRGRRRGGLGVLEGGRKGRKDYLN